MQQAKREGEWFAVGVLGGSIVAIYATPLVITYGSIVAETQVGSSIISMANSTGGKYLVQTLGKTGIDATAQYLITGDVNWLNAAAGSVLPGKAGYLGSPILSEGADVFQNNILDDKPYNPQKSLLKIGAGYMGNLSGIGAKTVSSDWSSSVGSFIFSNGVQSFHTQGNSEIIDSKVD